ncbi:MAG: HEAT repeat domain-containing protein [Candidatus Kariarchaeaceae archaeon]|jgi:hypothetical protein
MSKTEGYIQELNPILEKSMEIDDYSILQKFLLTGCNLPGRRANLELAAAFVKVIESSTDTSHSWAICIDFLKFNSIKAPTNDPLEFLPFCAVWGIGGIASKNEDKLDEAITLLYHSASDPRWRIREAVAKGLQKLLQYQSLAVKPILKSWITGTNWLAMRATVAGLAEEVNRSKNNLAEYALSIHKTIFETIQNTEESELTEEHFTILKKGLSYTLSVIVEVSPESGFSMIQDFLGTQNKILTSIISENLKKKRLVKNFQKNISALKF